MTRGDFKISLKSAVMTSSAKAAKIAKEPDM